MYDELTRGDVQKMQEEIDYRTQVLRPKLIEDVQTARAFSDLSENFEYKCAKQEKNRNDSRIRYLQRMIKTARIIDDRQEPEDPAGHHPTAGCTEGPHQQGVPGGEGRAGPPGRGPGTGGYGRRPQLLDHHPLHRKRRRRRLHPHRQLLSPCTESTAFVAENRLFAHCIQKMTVIE